ncbi:MAG: metal-sensitive transcriptional regulator [Candidatus Omnitrophota bacterium]
MATKKGCISKERKSELLDRLSRIEGQIKGMKNMIEDERYCLDILQQVSSTFEALRGVSKVLMRNYLEICATDAMQSKRKEKQEEIYNELMDIIYKFAK